MKNYKEIRELDYYFKLKYPVTLYQAEEGGYVAEIEDLPGCITQGETPEEALQNIEDARVAWLEAAYGDGVDIPLPRTDEEYSGKFVVRIPKHLHRALAERARREGVSLNQYVAVLLAEGISARNAAEKTAAQSRVTLRRPTPEGFLEFLNPGGRVGYFTDWGHKTMQVHEPREIITIKQIKQKVAA